jgi:protein-disulfide reductase (glutathione)
MNRTQIAIAAIALLTLAACRQPGPSASSEPEGEGSAGDQAVVEENSVAEESSVAEEAPPAETPEERQAALAAVFQGDAEAMTLWNADDIAWMSYESGLAAAAARDVPAIVVVKTGWCPRCRQYADSFSDPDVVDASEDFVMILADQDHVPAVERDLSPDGSYVPRTHFLSPDGVRDDSLNSGRTDYRHFVNPSDPNVLLALMARAQERY